MPSTNLRLSTPRKIRGHRSWPAWGLGVLAACGAPRIHPTVVAPGLAPSLVASGVMEARLDTNNLGEVSDTGDAQFALPITIRGHTLSVLVDHGANASLLTDAEFDSLRLPHMYTNADRVDTLIRRPGVAARYDSAASLIVTKGDTIIQYWGTFLGPIVDSVYIGTSLQRDVYILREVPTGYFDPTPSDGLIGRDLLSQFDLEFNVPERAVRLYARSKQPGWQPAWLPHGLTRDDCIRPAVIRQSMLRRPFPPLSPSDTSGLGAAEARDMHRYQHALERMFDQTELALPVVVDGQPIDALFDSGRDETAMNWAEARVLGLTITSPNVRRVIDPPDTTYYATGVELTIDDRPLAPNRIEISDEVFIVAGGTPLATIHNTPMMAVGWKQFRDRDVWLSYSTGTICIGRPLGSPNR